MSAPALPPQLTYGRVRWTVIGLDTDTELDLDDQPDVVSINGRAYVTADVDRDAILGQGLVEPTTILTKRTELLIVNGRLQDRAGNTDVKLLANDSPGINPTGWSYTIEYELDDGYTFGSFSFHLSTGELVDLTREIPLSSPSPGVVELVGPPGPPGEGYGGGFVMGPLDPTAPTAVQIISRWGLRDDGSVYYDEEGASAAEAALLIPDPATGQFTAFRPGAPFSVPFDVQFSDLINDDTSASYAALTGRFMPASSNVGVNGQFLTMQNGVPTWVVIPVTKAMHDDLAARVTTTEGDIEALESSVDAQQLDKASTAYVDASVNAEALARVNADIDLQGQINANRADVNGQNDRLTIVESDFITSVEQMAAIDAATAQFRRYFGTLASYPAEAEDGDYLYRQDLFSLMVRVNGFWRQMREGIIATEAGLANIATASLYNGFTVFAQDTKARGIWNGTRWEMWDTETKTYNPTATAGGAAIVVGNGTLTGRYRRKGLLSWVRIGLTLGSTSNLGTGPLVFTIPFAGIAMEQIIPAKAWTTGGNFLGFGLIAGPATISPYMPTAVGNTTANQMQNAAPGQGSGTGVPAVAGRYTLEVNNNLTMVGEYETV